MSPNRARPDPNQALLLRAWTLGLLGGGVSSGGPSNKDISRCTSASWRLFLEAEGCALAIDERLAPTERGALPAETDRILRAAARHELKRALAARAQLNEIGQAARQARIPVAVLKGGVPLAGGVNLQLLDLDLLVRPEHGARLASALASLGYETAGWASPRHLAARVTAGGLRIEIHTTTQRDGAPLAEEVWRRLIRLDAVLHLERLPPAEHLWHLLVHLVVDHPYRVGRIRDLLVLADAVADCGADDLSRVERRCRAAERASEHLALLAAALSFPEGSAREDRFAERARTTYTVLPLLRWLWRAPALRENVMKWTFALLGGPEARREVWSDTLSTPLAPSPHPVVAALERRSPGVGRACRLLMRLLRLTLTLGLAAPTAAIARYSLAQRPPGRAGESRPRSSTQ